MAKVLVIDDDLALCAVAAHTLRKAGYEVSTAGSGVEAETLMRHIQFAAVITDLIMPDKDGLELIRSLRKRDKAIAIVAMSGGGATVTMDFLPSAQAFGADVLLSKPVSPATLVSTVKALLDKTVPSCP